LKQVFSVICIAIILVGCSNNDNQSEKIDANDINIEESDENSHASLPFDVEAFETTYHDQYDSFKEDYREQFENDDMADDLNPQADLVVEETRLLFKNGKMSEAVVFLSVLNDMVEDGEEEIEDLATTFIEDLLEDDTFASKTISDGLEIKIGAIDQDNVSIGIYNAIGQDE